MHAVDKKLFSKVYDQVKKRLFPFKIKEWLKMGLLSYFSNYSTSLSFNYSMDSSDIDLSGLLKYLSVNNTDFSKMGYGIFFFVLMLVIGVPLFLIYIQGAIVFMFIDSLLSKKTEIKKSYNKIVKHAVSFFKIRLLLILGLLLLGVLLIPLFLMKNFLVLLLLIIPLIIIILILGVLFFIINEIVPIIMYLRNEGFVDSFNHFIKIVKKKWDEFLVGSIIYSIMVAVTAGVYGVLLIVLLILPALYLIFASLIASFWYLAILFLFIIIMSYVVRVLFLPVDSFIKYYYINLLKKLI